MTDPVLIEAPAALLTLPEVRAHLKIDHEDEDSYLEGLITAAASWLDGWHGVLGRCILSQTWASYQDRVETHFLPFPDVQSAVVSYLDADGVSQVMNPADYRVRSSRGKGELVIASHFRAPTLMAGRDDAVTVTAVYGSDDLPPPLRVAAMMLIAHWEKNREGGAQDVPAQVHALISPYRVGLV